MASACCLGLLLHVEDGMLDTVQWSFTIVRDLRDVSLYSFFSMMNDLQKQSLPETKIEIRAVYLPAAVFLGLLGLLVDFPVITVKAVWKSPYMLFRGWHRLFQDCIGREVPLLETICVPFASLSISLWPLAVAGVVSGSIVSGIALGLYAVVIVYQVSSPQKSRLHLFHTSGNFVSFTYEWAVLGYALSLLGQLGQTQKLYEKVNGSNDSKG